MIITCSNCAQRLDVDSTHFGTQIACPTCGEAIDIREPEESEQPFIPVARVAKTIPEPVRPQPLRKGPPAPPPPPRRRKGNLGGILIVLILIAAGGFVFGMVSYNESAADFAHHIKRVVLLQSPQQISDKLLLKAKTLFNQDQLRNQSPAPAVATIPSQKPAPLVVNQAPASTVATATAVSSTETSPLRSEFAARPANTNPAVAALLPKDLPVPTDKVNIRETTVNGFIHPGIGLTKQMLETARAQLLAGKEPWVAGYIQTAQHRYAGRNVRARNESLSRPGEPDTDALNSQGIDARLSMDSERAQQQVLMYYFTGDEVYRANALRILRVWSKMDPEKYRGDYHISAGWDTRRMAFAAEILRATDCVDPSLVWTAEDSEKLNRNFFQPMIRDSMSSNGYFMNQANFSLMGAMAAFIFNSDKAGYDSRVEWFTVNSTAENQGMSGAIKQLARLVQRNDKTGQPVEKPIVQLAEMGRDGAHAIEDINLFIAISNLMMAQGTKVDPVTGTVSTAPNAVGPYEFLNDRILASADYLSRFMLGYETPWTPIAYSTKKDGTINDIYPRIADQYRGRMTTFNFWDLYFYYTYERHQDFAKIAPYLNEAYQKRITDLDWMRVPVAAEAEGKALVRPPTEPGIFSVARMSTRYDTNAVVVTEGGDTFLRVTGYPQPGKFALLSGDTDNKLIGLRVRTTSIAQIEVAGIAKPWIIPDTKGQWLVTTCTLGEYERFKDWVTFRVTTPPGKAIDIDKYLQKPANDQLPPVFKKELPGATLVTYVGGTLSIDFSAESPGKPPAPVSYELLQPPAGSSLNASTGAFLWKPSAAGDFTFVVQARTDKAAAAKIVRVVVARDRASAVREIVKASRSDTDYVTASKVKLQLVLQQTQKALATTPNEAFADQLLQLQDTVNALELLNPQLPDGTLDYTRCATSPELKQKLIRLTDGNSDTFAEYMDPRNGALSFDFGDGFQVAADAFDLQGRLNFEVRAEGAAIFGSNDGKTWTRLTPTTMPNSKDMVRLEVSPELRKNGYRYLKVQKTTPGIYEISEMRIHGRRLQNAAPMTSPFGTPVTGAPK